MNQIELNEWVKAAMSDWKFRGPTENKDVVVNKSKSVLAQGIVQGSEPRIRLALDWKE
jgi:hypothetical protein